MHLLILSPHAFESQHLTFSPPRIRTNERNRKPSAPAPRRSQRNGDVSPDASDSISARLDARSSTLDTRQPQLRVRTLDPPHWELRNAAQDHSLPSKVQKGTYV
ncbi:hypothetical protein FA13DRAFT_320959 [Coprinellus micaceus]|uniref:Uncharacterized protein n=1 Tax=Coprinellus micaceus TaxID=71717 RepID=A0A4Y7TDI6_COPMI|nr:hypothetical protein FA13DRAFT_319369 [Coprinellus micaceus]TEB32024.1 hypothetical protein FA13DRAFT_320959 [Coprinellus micaceus]